MRSKKAGILLLMILPLTALASDRVVLEGEAPVQDLKKLQLKTEAGKVSIEDGETDRVHWRVELEPKGGWLTSVESVREKLKDARVAVEVDGNTLSLKLDYPPGVDYDDCEQHWEVELPAAWGLDVKQGAGVVHVTGLRGGINVGSGVGEIEIDVPSGSVTAEVGVGKVDVVSATDSPGDIRLYAGAGSVGARIGDEQLSTDHEGLRTDLHHSGEGDDDYRLSVGVGDVQLKVENQK